MPCAMLRSGTQMAHQTRHLRQTSTARTPYRQASRRNKSVLVNVTAGSTFPTPPQSYGIDACPG